jgi:hypothetical protein
MARANDYYIFDQNSTRQKPYAKNHALKITGHIYFSAN